MEPSSLSHFPTGLHFCFFVFFTTVMVSHLCFLSTSRVVLPYIPLQRAMRFSVEWKLLFLPMQIQWFQFHLLKFSYCCLPHLGAQLVLSSCPSISAWPFANTTVLVSVARECTSKSGWRFYTTLNNKSPNHSGLSAFSDKCDNEVGDYIKIFAGILVARTLDLQIN